MYKISKRFHFSASHQLSHLAEPHPCARLHGHNYTVMIVLGADHLDARGFVVDYNELAPFGRWIDDNLDHRHLNDVLGGPENTTAERIARRLYAVAQNLDLPVIEIGVGETEKTWATYGLSSS